MKALKALLRKEFLEFFRNPVYPRMSFIFPLVIMLIIPLVATLDVHHLEMAVVDDDNSSASRRIIEKFDASPYFTLHNVRFTYAEALEGIDRGDIDMVVSIPRDFGKSIMRGEPKKVEINANGVNAIKGALGSGYAAQIVTAAMSEIVEEAGLPQPSASISLINYFNPTLNFEFFMIPALTVLLIILISGVFPALNLVLEKQNGTIQQINVTPVSKLTFVLSKMIPYWLVGLVVLTIALLVGWIIYGMVPAGNLLTIYFVSMLFILVMSGLGMIIANYSNALQQAMFVMFFIYVVFVLMSGLLTPIDSMPEWAQVITFGMPSRYYIDAMRDLCQKGTPLSEIQLDTIMLAGFAILFNLFAILTYKKTD